MNRRLPTTITCCKDCVYKQMLQDIELHYVKYGIVWFCIHDKEWKQIHDISGLIPDWCPLGVMK